MASTGGTGLSAMVSGKSAHKQFMIRQSKSDYVKRVCSAKTTIDNGLPPTFRRRLQRDGRLAKDPPQQPTRLQQQRMSTTQFFSTQQQQQQQQPEPLDLGGDLLETHKDRFTESRPFTPRTNLRRGGAPQAQSRLLSSGIYVRPPPKPQQPRAASANDAEKRRRQRQFDGTYDVFDGGLGGREATAAAAATPQPQQRSRTADWVLGDGVASSSAANASGSYSTLFNKIEEAYYPFAEAIIKDISNSGVTSNRMIRIIMQKHIELNKSRLKARQMEQVCQLIGEYLGVDDEEDEDEDTTSAGYFQPPATQQRGSAHPPPPPPQPLPLPKPLQPPTALPRASHAAASARAGGRVAESPLLDEDPTLTLTEVSQLEATTAAAAASASSVTPSRFDEDDDGDYDDYPNKTLYDEDDVDVDDASRSATPLDDFQDALRTQLMGTQDSAISAGSAPPPPPLISASRGRGGGGGGGADDARSVSEFGTTLRPGQFEVMQTMHAAGGSPTRGKTVRFSS